jgi:hypothetical protein
VLSEVYEILCLVLPIQHYLLARMRHTVGAQPKHEAMVWAKGRHTHSTAMKSSMKYYSQHPQGEMLILSTPKFRSATARQDEVRTWEPDPVCRQEEYTGGVLVCVSVPLPRLSHRPQELTRPSPRPPQLSPCQNKATADSAGPVCPAASGNPATSGAKLHIWLCSWELRGA